MADHSVVFFSKEDIQSFISCFGDEGKLSLIIQDLTHYFHYYLKFSSKNRQLYSQYRTALILQITETKNADSFIYAMNDSKTSYLLALKESIKAHLFSGAIFLLVEIYFGDRTDANALKAKNIVKNYSHISYLNLKSSIIIMQDFKEILSYHQITDDDMIISYNSYGELPAAKIEFNKTISCVFDTMLPKIISKTKMKCMDTISEIFDRHITTNLTSDEWEEFIDCMSLCAYNVYQITDDNIKLRQSIRFVSIESLKENNKEMLNSKNKGLEFVRQHFVFG